jgi:F-type H+-transporting ATPase subunit b
MDSLMPQFAFFLAAAATEVPPEPRVFGLDTQTWLGVGLTALNVAVLAFVLSKLLYKPVLNFLKARADRIKSQLDNAESEVAKAGDLKLQYEGRVKDIEAEKDGILETARKQAIEKKNSILDEAKSESEAAKVRATAQIAAERERAEATMKYAIIDVASVMAEKYVTLSLDKTAHDRLFAEAMLELEKTSFSRLAEPEEA